MAIGSETDGSIMSPSSRAVRAVFSLSIEHALICEENYGRHYMVLRPGTSSLPLLAGPHPNLISFRAL